MIEQLLRNHVQTYHNIAPLIKLDRKIPVWLHPLCIGRIHDCKKKAALGLWTVQSVYAKPFFLLHISLTFFALRTMILCLIPFKRNFLSWHIIFSLKRVLSLCPVSLQNSLLAAGQSTIQSLTPNDTVWVTGLEYVNTSRFTNKNSLTSRIHDAISYLIQLKTHPALGLKRLLKLLRGNLSKS